MQCPSDLIVAYDIDSNGRIVDVCEHWWPFALANGGTDMEPQRVLGSDLLDHISDRPSRELYRTMIGRVRRTRRDITLDIRCDSPDRRRFLSITISPAHDGRVRFTSRTLRVEAREPVAAIDASLRRTASQMLHLCSWCNRMHAHEEWLDVEEAVARLGVMALPSLPQISHGICPTCLDAMERLAGK